MNIVLAPDPLLRQVAEPVDPGDKTIAKLAKQMAKEMYKDEGVVWRRLRWVCSSGS